MKRAHDSAHTPSVAAVVARNAETQARNRRRAAGEPPEPLRPMPGRLAELDSNTPPAPKGAAS